MGMNVGGFGQTPKINQINQVNQEQTQQIQQQGSLETETFSGFAFKACISTDTVYVKSNTVGDGSPKSGNTPSKSSAPSTDWNSLFSGLGKSINSLIDVFASKETPKLSNFDTSKYTAGLNDVNSKIEGWGDSTRSDVIAETGNGSVTKADLASSGQNAVNLGGELGQEIQASENEIQQAGIQTEQNVQDTKGQVEDAKTQDSQAKDNVKDAESQASEVENKTESAAKEAKDKKTEFKEQRNSKLSELQGKKDSTAKAYTEAKGAADKKEADLKSFEAQVREAEHTRDTNTYESMKHQYENMKVELENLRKAETEAKETKEAAEKEYDDYDKKSLAELDSLESVADAADSDIDTAKSAAKEAISKANEMAQKTTENVKNAQDIAQDAINSNKSVKEQAAALQQKNAQAKDLQKQLDNRGNRALTLSQAPDTAQPEKPVDSAKGEITAPGSASSDSQIGGGDGNRLQELHDTWRTSQDGINAGKGDAKVNQANLSSYIDKAAQIVNDKETPANDAEMKHAAEALMKGIKAQGSGMNNTDYQNGLTGNLAKLADNIPQEYLQEAANKFGVKMSQVDELKSAPTTGNTTSVSNDTSKTETPKETPKTETPKAEIETPKETPKEAPKTETKKAEVPKEQPKTENKNNAGHTTNPAKADTPKGLPQGNTDKGVTKIEVSADISLYNKKLNSYSYNGKNMSEMSTTELKEALTMATNKYEKANKTLDSLVLKDVTNKWKKGSDYEEMNKMSMEEYGRPYEAYDMSGANGFRYRSAMSDNQQQAIIMKALEEEIKSRG